MAEATVDIGVKKDKALEDWQALKSNWKGRMSHLYNNEIMSDITFIVQDERFKAHKLVMASASSVFYAMFFGPVAEQRLEIEIVDCPNSEDFTEFLKFVYTEELSLTWENVFAVAYLAKKYYIPSLTDECCKFLLGSLTMENVLGVLNLCVAADQQEMAEECLRLIKVRIRELSRTKEFLELDQQALTSILKLDVLDMTEFDLFLVVDKWCKHQLDKKEQDVTKEAKSEILGDAVNLVRFTNLSVEMLANDCYPSGLITNDQFLNVVCFLSSKEPNKYEKIDKEMIPYETSRRTRSNFSVYKGTTATGASESYGSCFQVREKVWLKGLAVMGKLTQNEKVITIKGGDGTHRKPNFSIKVTKFGDMVYSNLIFNTSIEIEPCVKYNIVENMKSFRTVAVQTLSSDLKEIPSFHNNFRYGSGFNDETFQRSNLDRRTPLSGKLIHSIIDCEFFEPTVCNCWGSNWHDFPIFFFSKYDDLEIPTEEALLYEQPHPFLKN